MPWNSTALLVILILFCGVFSRGTCETMTTYSLVERGSPNTLGYRAFFGTFIFCFRFIDRFFSQTISQSINQLIYGATLMMLRASADGTPNQSRFRDGSSNILAHVCLFLQKYPYFKHLLYLFLFQLIDDNFKSNRECGTLFGRGILIFGMNI